MAFNKLYFLALLSLFVISCSGQAVKVNGFILTSKTDENDFPVKIYIWDGKTEYHLKKNKVEQELLEKVDHKVSAEGIIYGNVYGSDLNKKEIEIESYQLLD